MKLFSWSGLVFVLSLVFIWSCGYWLWLQNSNWQLNQQKTELTQQLEKAEALLQDWQQGYQLHLSYLQTAFTPATETTAVLDPLQELDERIRRILWPDPLLAYVVLDNEGKVLRFSSSQARQLFSQTRFSAVAEPTFLPPLVLPNLWVLPLQIQQPGQQLVLWFNADALQTRLLQQMATGRVSTEFLLLDSEAELHSRSRQQKSLLPRLGLDQLNDNEQLRLFSRRPPENLLQSRQRYQDAGAWPVSTVVTLLTQRRSGLSLNHYQNYLGRATVAAWRWLPGWQLYLVVEQDASPLRQQLKLLKQKLLAALGGLSLVLLLMFWYLHKTLARGQQNGLSQQVGAAVQLPEQHDFDPPVTGDLTTVIIEEEQSVAEPVISKAQPAVLPVPEVPVAGAPVTKPQILPAATALLQALLQQPHNTRLAELSRTYLQEQQQPEAQPDAVYACELQTELAELLQQLMQQDAQLDCLLELNAELPAVVLVARQVLFHSVELLLKLTRQRTGVHQLHLRLMVAANQQLRLELLDHSEPLTDGQWLKLLESPAVNSADDTLSYQKLQTLLPLFGARLFGQTQAMQGNKQVLEFQYDLPEPLMAAATQPKLHGRAMLLCPSGASQQLYNRILRQLGFDLLPMDDTSQLLQWCNDAEQQLEQLVIDESFAGGDITLVSKIATVVRRYFPKVRILLCVRQPADWQPMAGAVQLLAKPVLVPQLAAALLSQSTGEVKLPRRKVWLYQPDPLLLWWLEQQMLTLPYESGLIEHWPELPGDLQHDVYCLPAGAGSELDGKIKPALVLWCKSEPDAATLETGTELFWHMSEGAAKLSLNLYQLIARYEQATTRKIADESTL